MAISDDKIAHKTSIRREVDFLSGALILVDKPIGWTSFDVVNKIRFKIKHTLGVKKIKVGHAGTLDPLATGLLLICTGKLTKEIDTLQIQDKVYSGSIKLGETTATYDAELPPDQYFPTDHITLDMMQDVAKTFTGEITQIPPVYSAIKIDGKAAYAHARSGKDIEMKARK
ncbi:MAG: tRNA pseudouridine(55) synthase, partial [Saprospiraceae bacterium]